MSVLFHHQLRHQCICAIHDQVPHSVAFVAHGLLQVSLPYLRSEYGKEYDFDAPVKLLDSMMHAMADQPNQQVLVLGQVTFPYLHSQYGRDVMANATLPVKLLDMLQGCKAEQQDQQVIVLGQVKCFMPAGGAAQVASCAQTAQALVCVAKL
ncbi:hypothetical protein ABBQ32_009925 [Trebouxia sp. C0010 RCD-2024]